MGKALFKLYNNLTVREESEYFKIVNTINGRIRTLLEHNNFSQGRNQEDSLSVSYVRKSKGVYGNIGFNFNENSIDKTFQFYLTISLDRAEDHHFKSIVIADNLYIEDLATQVERLAREAVNIFKEQKKLYLENHF